MKDMVVVSAPTGPAPAGLFRARADDATKSADRYFLTGTCPTVLPAGSYVARLLRKRAGCKGTGSPSGRGCAGPAMPRQT